MALDQTEMCIRSDTRLLWSFRFLTIRKKRILQMAGAFFLTGLFFLPSAAISQSAADTFRGIPIRPEDRCSSYSSRDYPYSQSIEPEISVYQGGLFSPYSMRCFVSIRQTDIEHIVARSEAHDSGLCAASSQVREEFAEDLLNLTHAAPLLNRRQKIAYDASEWLPRHNRCWYANRIVEIKRKYGLTMDRKEADALSGILRNCPNIEMERPKCVDRMPLKSDPVRKSTQWGTISSEPHTIKTGCIEPPAANAPTALGWIEQGVVCK